MKSNTERLLSLYEFIRETERLKDTTRTAWTKEGRRESVAEHSWRLAVLALTLEDSFSGVDFNKIIRLCLVHDMGEAYEGDISATVETDPEDKLRKEERALQKLTSLLPEDTRGKILSLWQEYTAGETEEAKIAKALDKMETIIQHNQGSNPPDFDYAFNLGYGKQYALHDPILRALREIIDSETAKKACP